MRAIKHPKILYLTDEEIVAFQLKYILGFLELNDTQLSTLAYIYVNKDKDLAVSKMVKDKISKKTNIENYISAFRKDEISENGDKLIYGLGKKTRLNEKLKPVIDDMVFSVTIKRINGPQESQQLPEKLQEQPKENNARNSVELPGLNVQVDVHEQGGVRDTSDRVENSSDLEEVTGMSDQEQLQNMLVSDKRENI